jgi:hypothetical protein
VAGGAQNLASGGPAFFPVAGSLPLVLGGGDQPPDSANPPATGNPGTPGFPGVPVIPGGPGGPGGPDNPGTPGDDDDTPDNPDDAPPPVVPPASGTGTTGTTGTVPEPSPLVLGAVAALAVYRFRARRR